jgi:hypothetical protein
VESDKTHGKYQHSIQNTCYTVFAYYTCYTVFAYYTCYTVFAYYTCYAHLVERIHSDHRALATLLLMLLLLAPGVRDRAKWSPSVCK